MFINFSLPRHFLWYLRVLHKYSSLHMWGKILSLNLTSLNRDCTNLHSRYLISLLFFRMFGTRIPIWQWLTYNFQWFLKAGRLYKSIISISIETRSKIRKVKKKLLLIMDILIQRLRNCSVESKETLRDFVKIIIFYSSEWKWTNKNE